MIYQGTIRDGVVVLAPDAHLPEGTSVLVQPIAAQTPMHPTPLKWQGAIHNGVPLFEPVESPIRPDLDLVNKLRDETP